MQRFTWKLLPDGTAGDLLGWCAYTGQATHEARAHGWLDAIHAEDRPSVEGAWRRALAEGLPYQTSCRLRHRNGIYRACALHLVPVSAPDGRVLEWVGFAQDVHDSQQFDVALRQGARESLLASQLEAAFETASDGVLLINDQGDILRANAPALALLGYTQAEEHIRLPLSECDGKMRWRDVSGQPVSQERWPVSRLLRGETLPREHPAEMLVRVHDGRELALSVSGAPIRNAEGRITGALLWLRDMTEQHQLMQRNTAVMSSLLALAEALVVVADEPAEEGATTPSARVGVTRRFAELTMSVLSCERVALVSLSEGSAPRLLTVAAQTPMLEACWNEDWRTVFDSTSSEQLLQRLRADEVVLLELAAHSAASAPSRKTSGVASDSALSALIVPVRVGEQMLGAMTFEQDATIPEYTLEEVALAGALARLAALLIERERLLRERAEVRARELALLEANRRMDEFLSIASHELKTPLTSIKANIQLASRRLTSTAANHEANHEEQAEGADNGSSPQRALTDAPTLLHRVDRQANRLGRFIDDLLDTSRMQSGQFELAPARCDLLALVYEAVSGQQALWEARRFSVRTPEQQHEIPIDADAVRVRQAITNLFSNACKYSAQETPIDVDVTVEGARARVSVRDYGAGIPPEALEHVWERFYRVQGIESRASSMVGLGLGLSITRTIIERHGGTVGVESAPGQGSTFWFTLPLGEPHPLTPSPRPTGVARGEGGAGPLAGRALYGNRTPLASAEERGRG